MTTAEEYRKKIIRKKTIKVPSGSEFEIKALSPLDFWNVKGADLVLQGKADKVDPKINAEYLKMVLLKCVVSPQVVEGTPKENQLAIEEIDADDLTFIVNEVLALSTRKDKVDFLAEKDK